MRLLIHVALEDQEPIPILLPFTDAAALENILHCLCTCAVLGMDLSQCSSQIAHLTTLPMRLEWKQGRNNTEVIDDTYNADLTSLEGGLRFLDQHARYNHRMVILSDILQTGIDETELYRRVGALCSHYRINTILAAGSAIKQLQNFTGNMQFIHVEDTNGIMHYLQNNPPRHTSILLKGARIFEFERISSFLSLHTHRTSLEIDLKAIRNNILRFMEAIGPQTKLLVVLKASAYGSGSIETARICESIGVHYIGVAFTDEGIALRQAGIQFLFFHQTRAHLQNVCYIG
jgi:alanine racemase